MNPNVPIQVCLFCEGFLLTIFTLIWFLFCVNPYMLGKVMSMYKTFLTIFTLIWFLFCVNPNVPIQVCLVCDEGFLTIFTNHTDDMVSLLCESECADQSGLLFLEGFLTILTLIRFLFRVNPNVLCQGTYKCKTFLAILTLNTVSL